MALGSSALRVRWLVLRGSVAMLCLGALAGMALALLLGRYVENFLYVLKPFDGWVYSGAVIVLAAVTTLAAEAKVPRAAR